MVCVESVLSSPFFFNFFHAIAQKESPLFWHRSMSLTNVSRLKHLKVDFWMSFAHWALTFP
jgi:hypothetical protein